MEKNKDIIKEFDKAFHVGNHSDIPNFDAYKRITQFILKALDDQLNQAREIVNELENTNEDVWTGHEVKEHILKEIDKLK